MVQVDEVLGDRKLLAVTPKNRNPLTKLYVIRIRDVLY